jgi:hypothetical protein
MICAPNCDLAKLNIVTPKQMAATPTSAANPVPARVNASTIISISGVNLDELNLVMELGSREAIKGAVTPVWVSPSSLSPRWQGITTGRTHRRSRSTPPLRRQLSLVYPAGKIPQQIVAGLPRFHRVQHTDPRPVQPDSVRPMNADERLLKHYRACERLAAPACSTTPNF